MSIPTHFDLEMLEKEDKLGHKTFELSSTVTQVSTTRGTEFPAATYYLLPVVYLHKADDAAKENMRFLETVRQETLPKNTDKLILPKRKKYLPDSDWETSSEEYTTADTDISFTDITTPDGVEFSPVEYNYGIAITYKNIRVNALNQVQFCSEELSYKIENSVDSAIRNATMGDSNATEGSLATAATPMSNTVNGAQMIFGGDATAADNSLDSGDILTTDMIRKAKRMISSTVGYYWSDTTTHSVSGVSKNPWTASAQEPFVLFISPESTEALLGESQFVNAAEYGSNEVVLTGEIGRYLGIKIIETSKCTQASSGDYVYLDGTINPQVDVQSHLCMLVKVRKYAGLVWGAKPNIDVFKYPSQAQVRMVLNMAYQANDIHPDAIVRMLVSDA